MECSGALKSPVCVSLPLCFSPPSPPSPMAESEASWIDDKEHCSSPTTSSPGASREPQWTDNVVPPTHKNRTLILCFDGTGDKFDNDVSPVPLRLRSTRADHAPLEFERRSVHLDVEEGQQARANGILSGNRHFCNAPFFLPTTKYQAGIGTSTTNYAPGFINSITRGITTALDQAVAWSLPLHTQCACTHRFFVCSTLIDTVLQLGMSF